ncbi:protein CSF1 [Rhypophila decipiens]|uniref:Protein CSF1 n=1 Tax=Rhypophila decipiens TaxID=261697 RepID=A0AAN7B493_9PEZI|nr:protein CSF1 [Rhypophila decipiens]
MATPGDAVQAEGVVFNAWFLGALIGSGVLSIFSLLYFNRLFASVVSWALRTWTWHQYRVYIDIQAIQISLLAGRIFFTGLRYHGNNETILVQHGHITWAYWLRRVREVHISSRKAEGAGEDTTAKTSEKLPCRVNVSISGLEWFIYNRTPAYDSVLAGLTEPREVADEPASRPDDEDDDEGETAKPRIRRPRRYEASGDVFDESGRDPIDTNETRVASIDSYDSEGRNETASDEALPLFLQLLPIHLVCDKAAVVVGNENTKAILIVKAESMSGEVDASETKTPDPYRQFFRFKFNHPVIQMKENQDFKEDQATRAVRDRQTAQGAYPQANHFSFGQMRRKALAFVRKRVPYWKRNIDASAADSGRGIDTAASHLSGSTRWQGLSRYLYEETEDQKSRWATYEYAAEPTILDSPEATLTIFWDVVSKVPPLSESRDKTPEMLSNINGDVPPAWSIQLSVKGGSINYGPWADRQRADLQRTFVPSLCRDAVPARRLSPGAYRVATQFKLYVELEDTVTLRVPLREESKNWKWKGKEPTPTSRRGADGRKGWGRSKKSNQPATVHQRPFGWLDIKIAANATISYTMDMVAGKSGYSTSLDLDLPSTEISSSVNHELLWRSGRQSISCDLSTPLGWNAMRRWHFKIGSQDLELFLLREHIFLLTDLVDDWASGPPAEYLVFTPFKYHVNFQLHNLRLYMNLNDANIVDNPTDLEDNTYLVIGSPLLQVKTCIPIDVYRPSKNEIPFDVRAETASIDLHVPSWNTQASFLDSPEISHLENLVIDGTYQYNSTTSPSNTDTLLVNVSGQSPVLTVFGFVVRYFLKVKDNYFGDDVHFKTLEEYQDVLRLKESKPEAELANKPPPKKSNDLDVILSLRADDPKILLPAGLYSSRRHVQIDTACIALDLRFTNYYMEMELAIAPLNLSLGSRDSGAETPISVTTSTHIFVDGLSIYGHRLFGLPPSEPTYMCNWDISAGAVSGECTTDFLTTLMKAGSSFGFSFDDEENALIYASSIILYDITFLRVAVKSLCLWVHVEEAAFLLSAGEISVNFNDWARSHYSRRADIKVPDIKLSCVNAESATRHKLRPNNHVETHALVETSLSLSIIGRKVNFSAERKLQQELVRREDQRTHRAQFLLFPEFMGEAVPDPVAPPAQSVPPIPLPTKSVNTEIDGKSLSSARSSRRTQSLRNKSSFLSLASSTQSSILRPHGTKPPSTRLRPSEHLQTLTSVRQASAGNKVPGMHARDFSSSTRHSAFYSASGDRNDRQDVHHNTVAFSSPYFAPYFPLEDAAPHYEDAMIPTIEQDADDGNDGSNSSSTSFDLNDIDPNNLSEDCAYSSILLEMPLGLTAFCNPTSLRHVVSLLSALQASDPDDILDSLQVDAVKEIFGMQKKAKMRGQVNDFLVRVPHADVRFINCPDLESPEPRAEEQDQYDLSLVKLALSARSEERWKDAFKPDKKESRLSFHARLKSASLTASERVCGMDGSQAAVLGKIENVMASMGTRDLTYLDIDVGSIQASTSSEKIDYLALLIHRTGVLASDLEKLFAETSLQEKSVTKRLVRRLVGIGQDSPDPAFLIRPSAVLRSARQHIRTFDSWKLIMRLRQMWTIQSPSEKEHIKYACLNQSEDVPSGLRQEITTAFEKWRSWDLDNLSESVLLNGIFGSPADVSKPSSSGTPVLAALRVRQVGFVLDPGPKQNEVSVLDLTARCETKPTRSTAHAEGPDKLNDRITVLNVYCGDAAVNLNWELCELAGSILTLANRMQTQQPDHDHTRQPLNAASHKISQEHTIHCVLALGRGSVSLEAINLHVSSFSDGLKASLLLKTRSDSLVDSNLILSCDSVTSSLRSHSQSIGKLNLKNPSVFISHEVQKNDAKDCHTVKATASSKYMSLIVKQDPINIAEVIDLVVRDEVAQLYRLNKSMPSPAKPKLPSKKMTDGLSAFRVNVAMFMDEYTISLPLLRSLTYTVNGTVARIAMAADFGTEIIFDFDIKENSHEMQTKVNNVSRSISLLQIPPTNGRIRSHMDQAEHSVSVFASVELIQLDASAVHSLLSALNRPEISNAINELQHQGKIIQEHATEVLGDGQAPVAENPKSAALSLAYDVHLTFAGLEVFGNSPLESKAAPIAHISFALDHIHLSMSNRHEHHGPILDFPEIHAELRHIAFEVQKGTAEAMSSCGNLGFGAIITASSRSCEDGQERKFFHVKSDAFEVNLSPDTVSTMVDVLGYMGDKIKDLDTSREMEYLRKLRQSKPRIAINDTEQEEEADIIDAFLSSITYTLEIHNIQIAWLVNSLDDHATDEEQDLVLSLQRIEFGTRTRNSARLTIENLQLQMISALQDKRLRSPNSALLPEVIFKIAYVSTPDARRLAFQAAGKSLDIRLTSGFIIPAANLNDSIRLSIQNVQQASQNWSYAAPARDPVASEQDSDPVRKGGLLGSRRLEFLSVDADFGGAIVHLMAKKQGDAFVFSAANPRSHLPGKYGQFGQEDGTTSTALRSPGLALKVEYRDSGREDPSLYAEVKIDASSNILYPSVVPLIMDISNSVKAVVSSHDEEEKSPSSAPQQPVVEDETGDEDKIRTADPTAVLGRMKLNLGLRICRQEFSLSCQPIARVAATASFEDVYLTAHTVRSTEQGNFFAISGAFTNLQASVQHVYSRESTGSFKVESIVLSLMNSKHVSGTNGVSAILKVSPMDVSINAKQLQDFLLFREIWLPRGIKTETAAPAAKLVTETSQGHLVQRYQQVAATAAFPWTATISIQALRIVLDLGQALGKSTFSITEFWVSSKKTSDWEQNLCLGFDMIGVESTGRMSGFVALQNFKLRTSIQWPEREQALNETPMIQASVGFSQFRVKAAFDYQAFLIADITSLDFLMYNVRAREGTGDRLVAEFDGEAVQIFGTTSSAAQGVALYQAFLKLVQERKANFESSLKEIERYLKRKSVTSPGAVMHRLGLASKSPEDEALLKSPISLDTDVVVTLQKLNLGVFPSTFSDHQVFKMEALNAQARFAASIEDRRIHSILGLTLGQLRIGLAGVRTVGAPKTASKLSVEDVVQSATGSRGGTILKVPRVEAVMQTWQEPDSRQIDYIFKSAFEGKVEVGWNYSRISFIRGMWANHSKALARVWGKEIAPVTAIRVTGVPESPDEEKQRKDSLALALPGKQQDAEHQTNKITAEVKVPQSKYVYTALEPAIIETPQLRDMGEATPPLEWIGLNRDRLPNLTHQIVIVSLLELAGEVEDAYSRILGSS